MSRISGRGVLLVVAESVLIVMAIGIAAYIRLGDWMWVVMAEEHGLLKALLLAAICQTCLYYADLYEIRRVSDRGELFVRIVQALGGASFILAAVYFWLPATMIGRGVFLIAATMIVVLIVGWRVVFDWLSQQVGPRERLLLIGTSPASVALAKELFESRQTLGVDIVGFVDPDPARVGLPVLNPGIIGTVEDIPAIVRARSVDRVVVSLGDARGKLPMEKLLEMKLDGVRFDHLASVYEQYTGKIAVENLRPSWLWEDEAPSRRQARD
jgi:FlaA1/EpsC-like NDP-sugar epimerase